MSGGRGRVDWADLLAPPPARRSSAEVAAPGARTAAVPVAHTAPPSNQRRSYSPTSPRPSAQSQKVATLPRQAASPQPSPAARSSASDMARAALAQELAREAGRPSHTREPVYTPAARHVPTSQGSAGKSVSLHNETGAGAAVRKSASPQSSPAARSSASGVARGALEHELTRRAGRTKHAREPAAIQAPPQRTRSQAQPALEHTRVRQRSPKKQRPYCGNNKKARELLDGSERVGRPSECIQKGFGSALHQPVHDVAAFLRKFDGPYEKLIEPQLWYKNSAPPLGMQRATLPMCFQKGWGAGTAALARKLREAHTKQGR